MFYHARFSQKKKKTIKILNNAFFIIFLKFAGKSCMLEISKMAQIKA